MRYMLAILLLTGSLMAAEKVQKSKPDDQGNVFFSYARPDGETKCYRVNKRGNRKAVPCQEAQAKIAQLGKDDKKHKGNPNRPK